VGVKYGSQKMEISGLMTTVIYSGREKPERTGVGFIINKKWDQQVINKNAYNDRLVLIKLKANPNNTIIIQVYFPTDADENNIEEMYAGLEDFCNLATGGDSLIIMGDWNAVGEGADG